MGLTIKVNSKLKQLVVDVFNALNEDTIELSRSLDWNANTLQEDTIELPIPLGWNTYI